MARKTLMTRAEIDVAESKDFALGEGPKRPRDAATLIMLDKTAGKTRVLLGKRHEKHAFMPGKFVFPGGRTDPSDGRIGTATELHPEVERKLMASAGSRANPTRAKAIAMSAVRETYEEAGLLIGRKQAYTAPQGDWQGFAENNVAPSLENLRLIARAVTPPGRVRRFDSRFFAVWRDEVAVELQEGGPTHELQELVWLSLPEAEKLDIPLITRRILHELENRLVSDPELRPDGPVPYFRMLHGKFVISEL